MASELPVYEGKEYIRFHSVLGDAKLRNAVENGVKQYTSEGGKSTLPRTYSCSSIASTSSYSSTGSYCIEKRDIGLHFADADARACHEVRRNIEDTKVHSVHTSVSIPAGKPILGGLVRIGRRVNLNVFVITNRFLFQRKQFEAMVQPRVCNGYNTVLLLENGIKLPLSWRHFDRVLFDKNSFDPRDLALRILQYKSKTRDPLRAIAVLGGHNDEIIVINGLLCFIADVIDKTDRNEVKKGLLENSKITMAMLLEAGKKLFHPDIHSQSCGNQEELKKPVYTRHEIIEMLLTGVEHHALDNRVRFVGSNMAVFYQSSMDEKEKCSFDKECEDTLKDTPQQPDTFSCLKTSHTLKKKHATKEPILPSIPETTRIRHYLVKNVSAEWDKGNVKSSLEGLSSSLKSIKRVGLTEKLASFKIAIREDLATVKEKGDWPESAKIVKYYFPCKKF